MEAKTFKLTRVTLKSVEIQHTFFSSFKETCATTQIPGPTLHFPASHISPQTKDVMRGTNLRHSVHQLNVMRADVFFILTLSTSTEQFWKQKLGPIVLFL